VNAVPVSSDNRRPIYERHTHFVMSVKELRFGVIGADRRGRISLLAHRPETGQRVIAACSLTPERLGFYQEQCGPDVLLTADYREMLALEDLDAVFVCSPDHLHEEHAVAVMEAGKDVFLEKPMAISIDGCDHILQAAERTGRKLYVGHNMRFFPVMQKMKSLIEAGAIGEVQAIWCRHFISYGGDAYFRDWHSEQRYSNSLLLQKGAHDIDIIHWLAGSSTRAVSGMGKLSVYNKLPRRKPGDPQPDVEFNRSNWPPSATAQYSPHIDVEDHSMLLMQLENGVQASYLQCHYAPDDQRNYTIIGTSGRIENYGDFPSEESDAAVHLWNRRTGYSREGHEIFTIPNKEGGHGGADPELIEDFVRFLRGEHSAGAKPLEARNAVAVGCCGTDSLRQDCGMRFIPAPAKSGEPVRRETAPVEAI
jgi:predicted dehydrogenase